MDVGASLKYRATVLYYYNTYNISNISVTMCLRLHTCLVHSPIYTVWKQEFPRQVKFTWNLTWRLCCIGNLQISFRYPATGWYSIGQYFLHMAHGISCSIISYFNHVSMCPGSRDFTNMKDQIHVWKITFRATIIHIILMMNQFWYEWNETT